MKRTIQDQKHSVNPNEMDQITQPKREQWNGLGHYSLFGLKALSIFQSAFK